MLTRRTVTLALGLVGMLLLVPLGLSVLRMGAAQEHPLPLRSLDEATAKSRLRFPDGSRLIEGEWLGMLNTYGYAKVELPAGRLEEFLSQAPFHGKYERSNRPVPEERNPVADTPHNPALLARWKLSGVTRSIVASGGELNSPVIPVGLFVDLDDPRKPVAYLHWYD